MPSSDIPHGPIWHGATVLVVDNEPAQRELVRRRLEAVFSADDLYHAVRDAITRSTDLTSVAEADLVVAARELRRIRDPQ